jgi:4-oxalocrotonate tautomerase family enzyme
MPHIIVYCPRLERDKKIACVAALTEAFARTTGHDAEILTIHIEEHSYDNVGVGGKLLSETYPDLAKKEIEFRRRGE